MNGHHLILGKLRDYVTGEELDDTLDERYRQKIERYLVTEKGFAKKELIPRQPLIIRAGSRRARMSVDLLIRVADRICGIVYYGPGSLVTRHRPALAASRLVAPYQVPLVVVTNGEDADILAGASGSLISKGFSGLPSREAVARDWAAGVLAPLSSKQLEMEQRILYAFEVDGRCPCDDGITCLEEPDERT